MPAAVETMFATVNSVEQSRKNRTVPWHGLGVQVPETLTAEEALEASGLNWTVGLYPTYAYDLITHELVEVPKAKAVIRHSDSKVLGRVGDLYTPFQNSEIFEFGDALVDTGQAKWDTAGSLKGGAVTFASFRLDDVQGIKLFGQETEEVDSYLLVTNAHDGSRAFRAAVVPIRVVCTNTLQLALGKTQSSWALRHTGSLNARVEEARKALELSVNYLEEFEAIAARLAETDHTVQEVSDLVDEWIPLPEKRGLEQAERFRGELFSNIVSTNTVTDDLKLTSWGILQGVTEWAEHGRDERNTAPAAERRLVSNLLGGPSQQLRNKAFATLTQGW